MTIERNFTVVPDIHDEKKKMNRTSTGVQLYLFHVHSQSMSIMIFIVGIEIVRFIIGG